MSVVKYHCNKCNRDKEFQRNVKGLETLKQCTITQNCTGYMSQVELLENHIRPNDVEPVVGVDDFSQRQMLYTMKQTIPRQQWKVEHNLGNIPVVSVYDSQNQYNDQGIITHIDRNNLVIDFPSSDFTGTVQCVVYDTGSMQQFSVNNTSAVSTSRRSLSYNGMLTVAILTSSFPTLSLLSLTFLDPTTQQTQNFNYLITPSNSDPTWGDVSYVVINGKKYTVCTFSLLLEPELNNNLVYFNNISSKDIFVLLSGSNRTFYDKISNQIIDASVVTPTNNQFGFVISNGELVCDDSIIQTIYPHIRQFNA